MVHLVRRFLAWKLAQFFVLAAETWLGSTISRSGEEAVVSVGASRSERLAIQPRIHRKPSLAFGPLEWVTPEQMDPTYWTKLPAHEETINANEAKALAVPSCPPAKSIDLRNGQKAPASFPTPS